MGEHDVMVCNETDCEACCWLRWCERYQVIMLEEDDLP